MTRNSKPKYMPVVKNDECRVYRYGVVSRRGCSRLVNITAFDEDRTERRKGDITSFSMNSRRRLREFLVKNEVRNAFPIGLTLTLPASGDYDFAPEPDFIGPSKPLLCSGAKADFPETINRFGKNLQRAFPRSGCVWRAELQRRGAPHLHCVFWLPGKERDYFDWFAPEDFPRYKPEVLRRFSVAPLHARIVDCWARAVEQTCFVGDFEALKAFRMGYGVSVEPLLNRARYMRYCCDHLSKHKQEQLGYKGRQWGVVGKKHFEEIPPLVIQDSQARFRLWRVLGKIRRSKEKADCVFGYRRRKYHAADRGTTVCGDDTLRRLCDWLEVARSPSPKDDVESGNFHEGPLHSRNENLAELASSTEANFSRFLWDDLSSKFLADCRRMAGSPFLRENGRRTGAATAILLD